MSRIVEPRGYVLVKASDHPDADVRGYIYEHRLVAERMLGRRLATGEVVHHRDGNQGNNDPANLAVMTQAEHMREHGLGIPGVAPKNLPPPRRGAEHSSARLTDAEAEQIRVRRAQGERGVDLAAEFGVSQQTVCNITNGRRYVREAA